MIPTFFSGVFLSSAINILTTYTFHAHIFEMLSMVLMFISCGLFFLEASKIHGLQTWYNSLPNENRKDSFFLEHTKEWDLWKDKDNLYKKILPLIPKLAWLIGLSSLLLYLFSKLIYPRGESVIWLCIAKL
jgi:hypothetical protein